MLKVCEHCTKRLNLNYEALKQTCGACRECTKADMVPHAQKPNYFGGKRWTGGKVSKISAQQVEVIKHLISEGYTQARVGEIYGVSQSRISIILKGSK